MSIVDRLRASGCVFAEDEARLLIEAAHSTADLDALVARRVGGEPLEYIVGWAEFGGRRIAVEAGVFVPRRRTEFLAGQAVARARALVRPRATIVVVDLCCGSGALGLVVTEALTPEFTVELYAADVDPIAVRCASGNLAPLGGAVFTGDLFEALPDSLLGRVDVLLANAPYVPTKAIGLMPPEARDHEARVALDGGNHGLDVLRRVLAGAGDWLAPGGRVLVETSADQAPDLITAPNGLRFEIASDDEVGATVVVGTRRDRHPEQ